MSRHLSAFAASLITIAITSCGEQDQADDQREDVIESGRAPSSARKDELVDLRFRFTRTEDHPGSESPINSAAFTALPSESPPAPEGIAREMEALTAGSNWESERLSAESTDQLQRLLVSGEIEVATENVVASDLRPDDLHSESHRGEIAISRPSAPPAQPATTTVGRRALQDALAELRSAFTGQPDISFKTIGIDLDQPAFATTVLVELRGSASGNGGHKQVNTRWRARWSNESPPRLQELVGEDYSVVMLRDAPRAARFVDATGTVLGDTPHYERQILTGVGEWAARITRLGDFSLTGHHGLAVGDVNGDGREDLFVCDGGSLPNRLYLQQANGTARDASAEAGLDWLEDSRSALLVDLDNDGDQDLVVATIAMIVFAENDGSGRFALRGGHPGAPYPFSLSAADYDNDGLLDVYACVYSSGDDASARGFEASTPTPFHDAQNGGRNVFLKNHGGFAFADVTKDVGLDRDNTRWSLAAAWEDYDRDGDPDLYVANDFGRNCLYRNDDGQFRQIAAEAGLEDIGAGMSVAWSDLDRDGQTDLYVGNMFSAAGQRTSTQQQFEPRGSGEEVAALQRMARGNSLFISRPDGRFRDMSIPSGTNRGGWAWSSGPIDINNDGWQDLAVSNGFLTGRRPDDL